MITEDGVTSSTNTRRNINPMKKIMSLMLGLSLVVGAASYAFAQQGTEKSTEKKGKKKGGKKGSDKKTT